MRKLKHIPTDRYALMSIITIFLTLGSLGVSDTKATLSYFADMERSLGNMFTAGEWEQPAEVEILALSAFSMMSKDEPVLEPEVGEEGESEKSAETDTETETDTEVPDADTVGIVDLGSTTAPVPEELAAQIVGNAPQEIPEEATEDMPPQAEADVPADEIGEKSSEMQETGTESTETDVPEPTETSAPAEESAPPAPEVVSEPAPAEAPVESTPSVQQ